MAAALAQEGQDAINLEIIALVCNQAEVVTGAVVSGAAGGGKLVEGSFASRVGKGAANGAAGKEVEVINLAGMEKETAKQAAEAKKPFFVDVSGQLEAISKGHSGASAEMMALLCSQAMATEE